jgi:hypothetical protein
MDVLSLYGAIYGGSYLLTSTQNNMTKYSRAQMNLFMKFGGSIVRPTLPILIGM